MKVRMAAIGVRSSWLTSARKSRLRSRSRRITDTLSSSRSAIVLNWVDSARSSRVPDESSSVATREVRSPSASRREASVSRVIGVEKRWAMKAATSTATMNAAEAMTRSSPVMAASVFARPVYGLERVTLMPQSWTALVRATSARAAEIAGSRSCPRAGSSASGTSKPSVGSGSTAIGPSASWRASPNRSLMSA